MGSQYSQTISKPINKLPNFILKVGAIFLTIRA